MKRVNSLKIMGLLTSAVIAISCGKKKDDSESAAAADDPTINSGSLAVNYALAALSSSQKPSSSATGLTDFEGYRLLDNAPEAQSTKVPDCSNKGAPWDKTTNQRMASTAAAYAQTVLYCQTNASEAVETIAGAFAMSSQILCAVDAGGNIEYTAEGKTYEDATITLTTACGFSDEEIAEMPSLKATINTKSYATGDWQKSIHIVIPDASMEFKLFMTAKTDKIAIKFMEMWDHDSRSSKNSAIAAGSKGTRGNIISIDRVNGILRAETADTYWGRRSRLYAKGSLDAATGKFTEMRELSGVFFDLSKNVNGQSVSYAGQYASVKGTSDAGFKYNSSQINGSSIGALQFTAADAACVPSTGCAGNAGITFTGAADEVNFMTVGGAHDAHNQSRTAFETWLESAGNLTFTEFTGSVTL